MKIYEYNYEDREILVSVNGDLPEWFEIVYRNGQAGIYFDDSFHNLEEGR